MQIDYTPHKYGKGSLRLTAQNEAEQLALYQLRVDMNSAGLRSTASITSERAADFVEVLTVSRGDDSTCPHPGIFRGERCPKCGRISGE